MGDSMKGSKNIWNIIKTSISIVIGNLLFAFAVAAFVMPHNILLGGITGIGIFLNSAFGIDTALLILILNVLLLMIGGIILGRKFFLSTVAGSLLYPIFLSFLERVDGIDALTDNSLLAALFAGAVLGIAIGMLMRVGSSSGGTDIINLIINKYTHISIAVLVYASDFIVIGFQVVFTKPEQLLLGIITLVLEALVLDKVMIIGKSQIQVFVVSAKYDEIRKKIIEELNAGVTLSMIETGLFQNKQKGVMCIIHPRKLYDLNELIYQIDPDAFITITKIKEVHGQGFTKERIQESLNNQAES